MDEKDEPVVSIVAGEAAPPSDPPPPEPPTDPPPPDETNPPPGDTPDPPGDDPPPPDETNPPPGEPPDPPGDDPPPPDETNPPPGEPPPANDPPPIPDAATLPALPWFGELRAPTLAEMSDQLAEDLYLDLPVARERLELTARQIAERYHLATAEAVDELAHLPRTARAILFATGADEHALILADLR